MAGRFSVEAVFRAIDHITAPVSKMQNRIGKLTRSMNRGFRSANKAVDKLSSTIKTGAIVAIGSLTAVAGTVSIALQGMADKADALAKQSRRLDFPIEDLQAWKFAAEQSGISTELFDQSMGAFSKRLGEARAGFGPLAAGLKKTNPELLEQLQNTDSVSKALDIYIKAMRNAPTAIDRAALANAAFSRAGLKMADFTANSTEALQDLLKEQRENGILTMQQAEAAEDWNDAVNSLTRSITGLKDSAVAPLLPMLTKYARTVRQAIITNRELIAQKVGNFFKFIKENGDDLLKTGKGILQLFGLLIGVITTVKVATLAYNSAMILIKGTQLALAASMLILKGAVIGFNLVIGAAKIAMAAFNLVMSLNPISLVIIAISALIAAGILLINNWDSVSAFAAKTWDSIVGIFQTSIDTIKSLIDGSISITDLFTSAWEGAGLFFTDLWDGIVDTVKSSIAKIQPLIDTIKAPFENISEGISGLTGSVKGFFGIDDGDEAQEQTPPVPSIVSPQERVARSIEEQRTTTTAEVTLKTDQGTQAEVTKGEMGPGLKLQSSGAF